jgi:hypothetical protein
MRTTFVALALVLGVTGAGLFATRSRPVVYAFIEQGDPVHEPAFSVFNPFRDRAPEHAANVLLEDLNRGDYVAALSKISDPTALNAERLERETESRLQSWRLRNRTDRGATTKLFYWADRGKPGAHDLPLWITVERVGDHWQVRDYDTWY